ncbi:uncharacterized protein LOC128175199 [Crassostrea angulata]|uniref:DNA 3'-5' helicase n=1 Tax=Magallana gigas TaxID=29159 RepID=A0A8W8MSR0_MAGGI|nr:ATP-dependent DNA helicase Q-like 3 [Crassostrea gigas]XP_052696607.1 uncharacterized protein LOC128175199 [Crassostrea angulata]
MAAPSCSFEECVTFSVKSMGIDFDLKEKQIEILKALYTGKDCVGILPTGYGKSLIFQLLPYFLQRKFGSSEPKLVLTVCPLSSLMEDQCMALRKKGLRVCMLNTEGTKGLSYKLDNSSSDEDEGDDKEVVPKFVQLPAIQDGNVDLLYAHPEALFTGKAMSKILRSDKYQKRLGAIVVDEVHIVTQW